MYILQVRVHLYMYIMCSCMYMYMHVCVLVPLSHPPSGPRADQVAVCRSLRELYQDRPLELARVTTELAVLLRPPDPHTE